MFIIFFFYKLKTIPFVKIFDSQLISNSYFFLIFMYRYRYRIFIRMGEGGGGIIIKIYKYLLEYCIWVEISIIIG